MRCYWAIVMLLFGSTAVFSATPFSHHILDEVYQAYVDSLGRVDYPALKAARGPLDAYMDSLARYSPHSHPARFPSPSHELAYWINAYNAFVLKGVIDAYPVKSVMDIKLLNGFFNRMHFTAGGEEVTLDEIENQIIRPVYKDPRIHAAVNCGAASCPALENKAFTGEDLEARLHAVIKRFVNDPAHVRLDQPNDTLHLSKIMDWYGEDFIKWFPRSLGTPSDKPTLIDYLLLYLDGDAAELLRQRPDIDISFNPYDWTLNSQSPPK